MARRRRGGGQTPAVASGVRGAPSLEVALPCSLRLAVGHGGCGDCLGAAPEGGKWQPTTGSSPHGTGEPRGVRWCPRPPHQEPILRPVPGLARAHSPDRGLRRVQARAAVVLPLQPPHRDAPRPMLGRRRQTPARLGLQNIWQSERAPDLEVRPRAGANPEPHGLLPRGERGFAQPWRAALPGLQPGPALDDGPHVDVQGCRRAAEEGPWQRPRARRRPVQGALLAAGGRADARATGAGARAPRRRPAGGGHRASRRTTAGGARRARREPPEPRDHGRGRRPLGLAALRARRLRGPLAPGEGPAGAEAWGRPSRSH
mmetsp:Transcript_29024/g.90470  ORF Transcript_29024/g.90470 Transcript_29024/m.90470 type:complete len:316 (+) Transcript_29024:121-1068(+)